MSINLKPIFPVACFLAWFFFIISCEEPEEGPVVPDMPGDTTIITPTDTIITTIGVPLALFTVANNYCTAICSLSFTNLSVYADSYSWDFGDGSDPSTEVNPYHFYTVSGIYQVILTASKSGHSEYDRDTQMVEIKRPVTPYCIGSSKNEFGTGLVQTGDGGYIVAGSKEILAGNLDVYLFKTDASRNVVWEKNFGGLGEQACNAIRSTSDGGYIIAGYTKTSGGKHVFLIRTDGEGNLIWKKIFLNATEDSGEDVTPTNDGGFLITGTSLNVNSNTDIDLLLIKTDFQGNVLWEKRLGASNGDGGFTVQQASDGNFIVAGIYNYNPGGAQPYMIKINNEGDIIWEQHNAADLDFIYSVQETSDGGFIWAGTDGAGSSHKRGVITKTDASGIVEWSKTFPTPGVLFNDIECVRQTSDGGYILCGQMDDSGYDFPNRRNILVIKMDETGTATWTKTYSAAARLGNAFDIQQTPDGGYILVGHMLIEPVYPDVVDPVTDYDVYLLKIDENGTPL